MAATKEIFQNNPVQNESIVKKEAVNYLNDLDCWRDFKKGNESAFIYIYQKHFKSLFNYGFQFTRDHDLIQDCIQDLFIELRNNRQKLSDTNSIKNYLFVSIRRKIIYHLKKKQKDNQKHEMNHDFEIEISIEDLLINRQLTEEKAKKIEDAIKHLTPRQREAIYFFYYENMSYSEVADVMNLSNIKSVRNIIYKALDIIKLHLSFVWVLGLFNLIKILKSV